MNTNDMGITPEKNIIDENKRRIHGIIALLLYALIMYLLVYVIQIIAIKILANTYPDLYNEYKDLVLQYQELIKAGSKDEAKALYKTISNTLFAIKTMSWTNFVAAFLTFFSVGGVMFIVLKYDFLKLKTDWKRVLLLGGVGVPILMVSAAIINVFIMLITKENNSENQQAIVSICKNGYLVPMFFMTVIMAPITEELVFRQGIFLAVKNDYVAIAISSLLFGAIHVASGGDWIFLLSYGASGLILSLVYYFSNKNIYASILTHMINNGISFILIAISVIYNIG